MESLAEFLSNTFPDLVNSGDPNECRVVKAIQSTHPGLSTLSAAIQVVDQYDEINPLTEKVRREHPMDRVHNPQYDARVWDCLTEACAFAWAASRNLGVPSFSDSEGSPDIILDSGSWIEVKAIHRSNDDHKRMRQMLAGGIDSGSVLMPPVGFYKKFCDSFADSVKKFDRQGWQDGIRNIVFFNLTSLDIPSLPNDESVNIELGMLAEEFENICPRVEVVMCYSYNWRSPFREPFA